MGPFELRQIQGRCGGGHQILLFGVFCALNGIIYELVLDVKYLLFVVILVLPIVQIGEFLLLLGICQQ